MAAQTMPRPFRDEPQSSGPFLTMVTGGRGLSAFPWPTLVGAILPLIIGIIIGNLDEKMRDFLGRATPVMIPFFAFALGASLDLHRLAGRSARFRARAVRGRCLRSGHAAG